MAQKGGNKMKEFSFEKKGLKFVFADGHIASDDYLTYRWKVVGELENKHDEEKGMFRKARYLKEHKAISFPSTETLNGQKTRGVKLPKDIDKKLAKYHKKLLDKKNKEQEKIKQSELIFKVELAKLDSSWGMTKPILVEQKDLLTSEQREKVRELKNLLGETAKFAGATEHIDAEELPLEEGEEITLDELLEMVKETKSYKRKEAAEQKEKEKYEEAEKEARETGENVIIDRLSVECNDPDKECSTDIITVYMTPSGRTKEERTHTY